MQKFGQIRAKSKNGLKFDIGRLCSQPFNYCSNVASTSSSVTLCDMFSETCLALPPPGLSSVGTNHWQAFHLDFEQVDKRLEHRIVNLDTHVL